MIYWCAKKKAARHLRDLEETFENIRKVGLRLKAMKCTFGVTEGPFLGFKITLEGIKARTEKVEVVTSMVPSITVKEV